MRRIVDRHLGASDPGVVWLRQLLAVRDTSCVDWLRIDFGRGVKSGAYGRCWYPVPHTPKGYRQRAGARHIPMDNAVIHQTALPQG